MRFYNSTGVVVKEVIFSLVSKSLTIDDVALPAGIYIVKLNSSITGLRDIEN